MSELLTGTKKTRRERLLSFSLALAGKESPSRHDVDSSGEAILPEDKPASPSSGGSRRSLWDRHAADIRAATPRDVIWLVDRVMQELPDMAEVKPVVSRMLNAFSAALRTARETIPSDIPLVGHMLEVNREIDRSLDALRTVLKQENHGLDSPADEAEPFSGEKRASGEEGEAGGAGEENADPASTNGGRRRSAGLKRILHAVHSASSAISGRDKQTGTVSPAAAVALDRELEHLQRLTTHYTFEEMVLFPVIEQLMEEHRCTALMWSIHDDVREGIKTCRRELALETPSLAVLNRLIGRLFFDVRGLIFREEQVLLPAVASRIPPELWRQMEEDAAGEGYVELSAPGERVSRPAPSPAGEDRGPLSETWSPQPGGQEGADPADRAVDLLTGTPTVNQLLQIFGSLPLDITLIDADDRVVFFSNPPHRAFPRTRSIIGRKVQQCHPPESVAIVERILAAFRSGARSEAEFRITVDDRYLLIRYLPIRSSDGSYAGTLEITQDISRLQRLSGEKRLLNWEDNE